MQHFGSGTRTHHTTDVWADHDQVFKTTLYDVVDQNRGSVNIVYGNIKKALNLVSMQVNRQHAVDTG